MASFRSADAVSALSCEPDINVTSVERRYLGQSPRIHAAFRAAAPVGQPTTNHVTDRQEQGRFSPIHFLTAAGRSRLSFSWPRHPMTSLCKITQVHQKEFWERAWWS